MADTSQTVSQTVPIRPDKLFAVLADPAQHPAIDGSGMVQHAVTSERITKTGDVFRMAMNHPDRGEYQMDNHVVDFEESRRIAWAPSRVDGAPIGHRWIWELRDDGDSTAVTHTYDWSQVPGEVLERVPFPVISAEAMEESIKRLASAAS